MTTVQPTASNDEPAWFVGFDWGSEKHRVALFDRTGKLIERRDVAHSAAAYAELGDWLLRTTQASPAEIAVAIETTHGPVVDALIDRGFRVYAINPKQLDHFRDRYSVAGAKSLPLRRPGTTRATPTHSAAACAPTPRRSAHSAPTTR
jgi:hypothetical protein